MRYSGVFDEFRKNSYPKHCPWPACGPTVARVARHNTARSTELTAPTKECIRMGRIMKSRRKNSKDTCTCRRIRTYDLLTAAQNNVKRLYPAGISGKPSSRQPPIANLDSEPSSSGGIRPFQVQCPTGVIWTVQAGDTLFNIARATGTTVERIMALNPSLVPENLQPGMEICLPQEAALPRGPIPPCESGLYWVVAQGDTLFSIARAYGTTVQRLLELNPGIDPLNLQIGMSICLPG